MSMLVLRHVLLPHTRRSLSAVRDHVRCLHPTTVALKKKKQGATTSHTFLEDPDYGLTFDGQPEDGELFSLKAESSAASSVLASQAVVKDEGILLRRAEMFDTLHSSTLDILRRPGKMRQPPRRSVIVRLAALSEGKEDLEKVIEVIAAWRSAGLLHDSNACDDFIGRCIRLKHPEIALKVMQDRPRYGMDVPSLASARRLLYALARPRGRAHSPQRILVDALAFAELYPLYSLPPASTDIVSCGILAAAVARQARKDRADAGTQDDGVAVTGDPWNEIMAELRTAVGGWGDVVDEINPKMVQRLRGSIRTICNTMPNDVKAQDWLSRFSRDIQPDNTAIEPLLAGDA